MENYEKQDLIFEIIYDVLKNNFNWIKYQDLINQVMDKIKLYQYYSIKKQDVIKFVNECEKAEYLAFAKSDKNDDNFFVCGYWVGLNKNDD